MPCLPLRRGARPDGPGHWSGGALLDTAFSNGDLASVKALLVHGLDPNAPGEEGVVPLVSAVLSGSRITVEYLSAHGTDVRKRFKGRTAVDYARDTGDLSLVRTLEAHTKSSI